MFRTEKKSFRLQESVTAVNDFINGIFRNFARKKFRTFLTVLGIAIGVASVITIADISQGGADAVMGEMDSLGMSGLMVTRSAQYVSTPLSEDDWKLVSSMSQVDLATPVIMGNTLIQTKQGSTNAILWGIDDNAASVISITAVSGRFFNRADIRSSANVCLVDESLAEKLYHRRNITGKKISLFYENSQQEFTVIGIIKTGSGLLQNIIGSYIPTFVYIPYTTAQKESCRNGFDEIIIKLRANTDSDNAGKLIQKRLDYANGTTQAFTSNDLSKQKDGLMNIMGIITLLLSAVGAVSLLVASLSIMTMMTVSVTERTREIGIKKALGATNAAVMTEFLLEAVLLSLIGSAAGILLGTTASWIFSIFLKMQLSVRCDIMLLASLFAVASGVIFSIYPARQASHLRPVDALRQE